MAEINNIQVYGLAESIFRSSYPMLEKAPLPSEFNEEVQKIKDDISIHKYDNPRIKRAIQLAQAKGGGHDQFLTGIKVAMDLTVSNKCWPEIQRYKFLDFISSMSSIHRIAHFPIGDCCNEYTSKKQIKIAEELQAIYNNIDGDKEPENKRAAYLALLYNIPSGFELMAGMSTNYRCLKNIRSQRRHHPLKPDWGPICDWIETLPMANELIIGKGKNHGL